MAEQTEVDLINRDPNNLNDHVKVMFEDVLGEPEGAHSADCVWRNSYKCFNCGKSCCYKFLTYLCGILTALCWGCNFACITFEHIWCITPFLRVWAIYLGCMQKFLGQCYNCCVSPFCEACGMFFSNIRVVNSSG
ncbi:caveolin-3-like [Liolophura sinensis]|uniref:caveolin-3-like n=1 Tax=Liolophura sinensis TaxID=3198878 RepID=UPI00315845D9